MQYIVFERIGVPFWLTVVLSILLIWLYTKRGGIKTIVWTDTLQTLAMLTSVGVAIYLINDKLANSEEDLLILNLFKTFCTLFTCFFILLGFSKKSSTCVKIFLELHSD